MQNSVDLDQRRLQLGGMEVLYDIEHRYDVNGVRCRRESFGVGSDEHGPTRQIFILLEGRPGQAESSGSVIDTHDDGSSRSDIQGELATTGAHVDHATTGPDSQLVYEVSGHRVKGQAAGLEECIPTRSTFEEVLLGVDGSGHRAAGVVTFRCW
jgi:hypothetical protein